MIKHILCLGLLSALVACQNQEEPTSKEKAVNNQVTGYDRSGLPNATKDSVEFRLNPNPKQAYRVKVKVDNAPGPWKHKDLNAQYMARNCFFTVSRFAGATGSPEYVAVIEPEIKRDDYLKGVVYLDAMLDEDYYGQGTCQWELVGISAMFKATDDPEETIFIAGGFKDQLFPNQTNTMYYLKKKYPKTYVDGEVLPGSNFGVKKERRNPKYPDSDWFSITISVEEIQ